MTLATDLAAALDPVLLARRAGIEPDPWQADVMRSPAPRLLLNCSRQSGKSTTTAALVTHTALYVPNSLTLMLSPSQRQSGELFRKVLATYRALDRPVAADSETKLTLELENGSRIVSLPGKEATVRSFSGVDLLVVDEASRVEDALYYSVRPMLATSRGRLVALSTPWGKRGWWYEAWSGPGKWERYAVPATACPRISPEFLAEEEASLGRFWFQQEYLCKFLDNDSQAFTRDEIDSAFKEDVTAWDI